MLRYGPRRAPTLYNAARTFALVGAGESEKTNEDRQERAVGVQYQDRALQLLREALEALPAEQRRSFWKRNIERDAALNFVRRSAEFQRLARTYATPAATTGPLD